ncbi:hypothetical protein L0P88_01490 [Muricauda sp. SCSIO 64092]|uniref:hypothetical protein n=1 Tax=Allomuricauda sp. SCSIO 64092 TaxID=2908842 RepID=UPI001FF42065|nr:hypothetical protein [Muricauda sp. SCSIO 64092]UOY07238.1 hypothetical protein L0P88_01490 [Muricauda sp. SCSIO 64092]
MWKLYQKVLERNKRLEEENKGLMADIRILSKKNFSPEKEFVKSKWRKHFKKEETFKKLWKEIQPRRSRGN